MLPPDPFSPWLLGGAALVLALVAVVLVVRRRIVRGPSAPAPTDAEVRANVRAWLAAAPGHALALQHMLHEHGQLRARADAAEQELAPLRDRVVQTEVQCEQLRQELSRRDDQLEALRKDWEDVTQRVSQVLLDLLDRRHDAH